MTRRRFLLLASLILAGAVAWFASGLRRTTPPPASFSPRDSTATADLDVPLAFCHILISYRGCANPIPGTTRSETEARNLALQLATLYLDHRYSFEELARKYSDDPSAQRNGGYLGIIPPARLPLSLAVPLSQLAIGAVYPLARSSRGYHVLLRVRPRQALARHILIAWKGARGASGAVTRTRAEAEITAEAVMAKCREPGADFCDLAAKFSDDANSRFSCGLIGMVSPGDIEPKIEQELFKMKPGELAGPIETPYGFHILRRDAPPAENPFADEAPDDDDQ